ncbi:hypothetical protein [Fusobacterium ulcerans]|uniref:hypothetical protein n=1 Tax=Fusobacterium ulcerans TaxID=861 RepID=UPI003FF0E839
MNKLNYFNRICMFGIPILRVISLYIKIPHYEELILVVAGMCIACAINFIFEK